MSLMIFVIQNLTYFFESWMLSRIHKRIRFLPPSHEELRWEALSKIREKESQAFQEFPTFQDLPKL